MYAHLVSFRLATQHHADAEAFARRTLTFLEKRKGFKAVTFFGDRDRGEYASLILWESRESAEDGGEPFLSFVPLARILKGRPVARFFEVYDPKRAAPVGEGQYEETR